MIEIETKGREERGGGRRGRERKERRVTGETTRGDYGETRESKKSERYKPPIKLILITNGT